MEQENKFLIPVAIVIAGGLIAWGTFFSKNEPQPNDEPTSTQTEIADLGMKERDQVLGNPEAEIILVTYSDFECPYCKNFHETMIKISDEYGKNGKIAWVFRHFPVHGLQTQLKAAGSECVANMNETKFWEFTNKLFTVDENGWPTVDDMEKMVTDLGLDKNEFNRCMADGDTQAKVEADFNAGIASGVEGTPHTIVYVKNSTTTYPISGAQSYENVKAIIEGLLEESKI
ncbi:MAG: thioredoxin domain-containing protein [Patescibacteria group bacterium]